MKNFRKYINITVLALLAMTVVGCNEDFEGEIVKDSRPAIPVTFDGATTVGFSPYYTVSYANGNITLTLSIPDDAGMNIKEVSNIVAGTTAINVASISAAPGQYLPSPVAVNGKTYTLTTNITEYNTKTAGAARITAPPAAGALVERAFMFKLKMDDDSIIVPVQVRIRLVP
jgi:hypothetical protein